LKPPAVFIHYKISQYEILTNVSFCDIIHCNRTKYEGELVMKNCWNCENQIPKNAKVCKFCGSVQLGVEQEKAKPDKENNASCDKK